MAVVHQLEHPELFRTRFADPFAFVTAKNLLKASHRSVDASSYHPDLALIIRTKNDRDNLERWLHFADRMKEWYGGHLQIIVVDTESNDGTKEIGRSHGATVVDILQKDFSYPNSLNVGIEAAISAKPSIEIAFVTVGHAKPALSTTVASVAHHFNNPLVTGVFGPNFADYNGSIYERGIQLIPQMNKPKRFNKPAMGLLGATNAAVRISAWQDRPFDERFSGGGEDTEWARRALANGEEIIREPAAAVHHSHGLGLKESIQQWRHWMEVYKQPTNFDTNYTMSRRSDLRSKNNR